MFADFPWIAPDAWDADEIDDVTPANRFVGMKLAELPVRSLPANRPCGQGARQSRCRDGITGIQGAGSLARSQIRMDASLTNAISKIWTIGISEMPLPDMLRHAKNQRKWAHS
ncbi:hypothetical protein [Bradyrhizobium tropiciagri]|uniref:hypothetical protein n=1 Tax=Bradyrhizobium tropiciagri TaxID=312253 RepID=UPI00100994BF|nr:hypothetical protein [Bradyrhizobium tropiciagri]